MKDTLEMIVAVYVNAMEADQQYKTLRAAHLRGDLHVIDAAVLVKDKDGNTRIEEEDDLEVGEGTRLGAIIGGILGLAFGSLGGPLGAAIGGSVGMAAGGATGGATAGAYDAGVDNQHFKRILQAMTPSSSALVLVAEPKYRKKLIKSINMPQATLKRYALDVAISEEIIEED